MSRFHSLKIKEVRAETRDAVSIAFDVPTDLADSFHFQQGQHLVVRAQLDGEEVRRSYSICSGVNDGELRVAIKRVPGGRFSAYANDALKAGSSLEVMPPSGHFNVALDPTRHGNYLAVAAGSGITPILSIIKTTLETEPHSRVTLLYGNRSSNAAMFREQLEDLKNRYLQRLNLIFVFSREQQDVDLYNGRIDADKCGQLFSRWLDVGSLDAAFICGPQAMTETVRDQLQGNGMPAERIHFELFAAQGSQSKREAREAAAASDSRMSQVTVISDGRELSFELARNSISILDAGNAQGAELPYSCKAGVCSTCKCKVVEGEVEMDSNFALEDYEVAAGYVLSCQCFPLTDKVVLDFDQL
ncbi:phenylacetate-CoA oxygenase/reductase subunit PaaK [Pseudomonas sp. ZM23]|uniref:Phenylacetate-CoA oxygenase/reductase subunit PaaK n=1 Tax=Pseudomonas triclosanedens TaxID=2961893 RepID=A0ABY7A5J9_9PSED|nr:1,2-phenylacetyl-CoA epoxidase subunit PaaE [Pseudomonas triclosanedens]MCP8466442.1 phenylacetate-CoA oxygenase/reductase subunit PaaK [Pseudomonas triclosanedens]MCP8473156.1 phenylacetate-CoA oxygenase/reductase subunit PaaK [Pseudomonas triclosanedens]MCP8479033.1 phenylacetate-CoA oxygenase/reductase subunit PaaK [Pseudomonas triclosanedens]WAI52145.1 phenylacetate-CoA oxygenase/reductase subunit PaaK [Pseudomonas triclosanedens]